MKNRLQLQICDSLAVAAVSIVFGLTADAEDEVSRDFPKYGPPRQVATLENEDITESSGLAASTRTPGVFWTHNDSGDPPRLFSFDERGRHLGECKVKGAKAVDWEAMTSFQQGEQSWLVLGDVGDNAKRRKEVQLYLLREPKPTKDSTKVDITIRFTYSRGPQDCEAVAVDPHSRLILLAAKNIFAPHIFVLPLPEQTPSERLIAKSIGRVAVPLATGMSVSHDGRRAVITTYADAFDFVRGKNETWASAFQRPARQLKMPARMQGEAICFGPDSYSLFLTSEKLPTPLWKVTPVTFTP